MMRDKLVILSFSLGRWQNNFSDLQTINGIQKLALIFYNESNSIISTTFSKASSIYRINNNMGNLDAASQYFYTTVQTYVLYQFMDFSQSGILYTPFGTDVHTYTHINYIYIRQHEYTHTTSQIQIHIRTQTHLYRRYTHPQLTTRRSCDIALQFQQEYTVDSNAWAAKRSGFYPSEILVFFFGFPIVYHLIYVAIFMSATLIYMVICFTFYHFHTLCHLQMKHKQRGEWCHQWSLDLDIDYWLWQIEAVNRSRGNKFRVKKDIIPKFWICRMRIVIIEKHGNSFSNNTLVLLVVLLWFQCRNRPVCFVGHFCLRISMAMPMKIAPSMSWTHVITNYQQPNKSSRNISRSEINLHHWGAGNLTPRWRLEWLRYHGNIGIVYWFSWFHVDTYT